MRPLRRGLKSNIFDNMLAMTEKYASNLEALVDERTQLLIEEKQVRTPLQFFESALTKSQNHCTTAHYVVTHLQEGHSSGYLLEATN